MSGERSQVRILPSQEVDMPGVVEVMQGGFTFSAVNSPRLSRELFIITMIFGSWTRLLGNGLDSKVKGKVRQQEVVIDWYIIKIILSCSEDFRTPPSKPSIYRTYGYTTARTIFGITQFCLLQPRNRTLDHRFLFIPTKLEPYYMEGTRG